MDATQHRRLAQLQAAECPTDVVQSLYGITLEEDPALEKAYMHWLRRRDAEPAAAGFVNRYRLELFFQATAVLPRRWAAVRMGMTPSSIDRLLEKLEQQSWLPYKLGSRLVVSKSFQDDLITRFDRFRFRTFGSHSDFCRRLHEAILEELEIAVDAEYCVTSRALSEDSPKYAYDYDCITGDPISSAYRVWLDLHKPISLSPDCCSLLYYANNEAELASLVAGSVPPEIPPALREAAMVH